MAADVEPEPGTERVARRAEAIRLADTIRRVIDRLVNTRAPASGLAVAADRLEELVDYLEPFPQGRFYEGFAEAANAGDPTAVFDHSPLMGRANPLAPPIRLDVVGERVSGRATFGNAYEGPPGCVHGGLIAAAFDDVLGLAQTLAGAPGMTGTLTVVYRSPTPLHTELTLAGWIDRRDGRKTFAKGTIHDGDRLCAEADAVFIAISADRFRALRDAREQGMAERRSTPDR
ncbi:MAG TPA: PaaI family thioesterase [Acidimicrobiales bacterium]|jgi:acyl-coenzyme A thioesterase PaaI-like protein